MTAMKNETSVGPRKNPVNVVILAGTRPEVIKLAPVIEELERYPQYFNCKVVVTGQHRELLSQMLQSLHIEPEEDFAVMRHNQSLNLLVSRIMKRMDTLLKKINPDLIISQGDTTSALCAALAAYYSGIDYGHVEAGLRTYDLTQPFPEEGNRRLIDVLADFCWAPTAGAAKNLLAEGIDKNRLFVTGNTVIDCLLKVLKKIKKGHYSLSLPHIPPGKKMILMTIHRRENWGEPAKEIFSAVKSLARERDDVVFVYPVHFTPAVKEMAQRFFANELQVQLVQPLEYLSFIATMDKSYLIVTDSGGIQEEAPALGKPVLVLREVTERPEGIKAGTAKLVSLHRRNIIQAITQLLDDPEAYRAMAHAVNPYGDGQAAVRIVQSLRHHYFGNCPRPLDFPQA